MRSTRKGFAVLRLQTLGITGTFRVKKRKTIASGNDAEEPSGLNPGTGRGSEVKEGTEGGGNQLWEVGGGGSQPKLRKKNKAGPYASAAALRDSNPLCVTAQLP